MDMKLVFIGHSLDHINYPLCENFVRLLGDGFRYVATSADLDGRSKMIGSTNYNDNDFVIKSYEDEKKALAVIDDADVVLYGAAPERLVRKRMLRGKLTFRCTERLYKDPFTYKNFIRRCLGIMLHHGFYQNHGVYILCAGAYTSCDFNRFRFYKNRCLKWGYFTKLSDKTYEQLAELKKQNHTTELVWVARFIELKNPYIVVRLAQKLKEQGLDFHVTMIGCGDCLEPSQALAKELSVEDRVTFTGAVKPETVREYMEKADISLFTSNRLEGWGAVVNEAMGSGCAVVASSTAGSSCFLIHDKEDGLLFDTEDLDSFYSKTAMLVADRARQRQLGEKAYKKAQRLWTAKNAAESVVEVAEKLLNEKKLTPKVEGPCSVAEVLKDGWYKNGSM